ncbi:MAG: hypothetical protein A3B91_05175 [Candidatus Yanofskybacteria bacterium RIFCSPHIGHO2_02_FULL_41_29]|nr:MAG: hypothetical protein A3B91_05175 [Candidatus Yanofskybacteria bacterium RIFCSPHIGHO2_02_FULL_41_29]OGN18024.1 MAG: hypothetical protein A3F48_03225 [Candidatus Yanofskybacteria bacterium RIFCSPHIGHO2_12_FULL_41_9]OGN30319.1 MAG: hypothetical protein A3H54_04555 [Candidatus Yanofskybacteria bacterium RIFCSPLOWO2_02_FULL_41_13]OGN33439.1 MAG: hypothetical protein A3F98_00790 [Candidatus Yanofskybacteria bacterium RIFCSPLOWO2_12_FULL_41_8]
MIARFYGKLFLVTIVTISAVLFWGYNGEDAWAVGINIDDFNVQQSSIPPTASSVDFTFLISQQDMSLNCPGGMDWAVFYAPALNGYPTWVRSHITDGRNTNLPLSPNPFSLDFREPNFIPDPNLTSSGTAYFRAAVGCSLPRGNAIYTSNWALSTPICVEIMGGSGNCSVPSGQGINITNFDLNPKTCKIPNQTNPSVSLSMTFKITVDPSQLQGVCGSGTNFLTWGIKEDDHSALTVDQVVFGGVNYVINLNSVLYTDDLSGPIVLQTNLFDLNNGNDYYAIFYCPATIAGYAYKQITASNPINIKYTSGGNYCVTSGAQPVQGGTTKTYNWSVINPLASLPGGSQPKNVFDAILLVSNWILNIAGALIILLIIYSGVQFMISRGNPGEINKAKSIIWWALVGFAVILIGKGFLFVIEAVLNNQIPTIFP